MHQTAFNTGIADLLSTDVDGTISARLRERLIRDREARLAGPADVRIETTIRAYDAALEILPRLRQQNVRRD